MTIDIPPEAKRLYNDAVLMIQENLTQRRASHDNSEVIDSLKSAVREFPKFFEAWRLLGEMCLSTEQVLLGYLALRRAWDLQSDDPAVATLLAEAALMLDRPGLALDYLEKMKTGEEASPVVKKLTARALAKAEMWEEALRSFGDALAEDPSDGNTRRDCAEILSNLNYPKDAANILADYLDPFREFIDNQPAIVETDWIMHPGAVLDRLEAGARKKASKHEVVAHAEDFMAWYQLANTFLDGEKFEAAVVCYRRALRVHPDFYDALHNMGIALQEMGRSDEAMKMYEAALDVDPEASEAYLSMAELMEEISPEEKDEISFDYLKYFQLEGPDAEGFEDMEEELIEHLRAAPDVAEMLLLADIYLDREEPEKAERMLSMVEAAGGDEADIQRIKGYVLLSLKRYKEAERAFRKGLESVGETDVEEGDTGELIEPVLRLGLAELLVETNRMAEALELLRENPDSLDPDGLALLAELLVETKPKEAEGYWQKALDFDPCHIDSLVGLADRMIQTSQYENAIVYLERALKEDPEDEETIRKLRELYPEIGVPELSPELPEAEGENEGEDEDEGTDRDEVTDEDEGPDDDEEEKRDEGLRQL